LPTDGFFVDHPEKERERERERERSGFVRKRTKLDFGAFLGTFSKAEEERDVAINQRGRERII